jgi:hypothetical protein
MDRFLRYLNTGAGEGDGGGGGDGGDAGAGDGAPAAFDWNGTLPDNLPPQFQSLKGKTWNDVSKQFASMQSQWTKDRQLIKQLQETGNKPADQNTENAGENANTLPAFQPTEWSEKVSEFHQTGEIDPEFVERVTKLGIPEATVNKFFEWVGREREGFLKQVEPILGPVSYNEIESWIADGNSPFTQAALDGFNQLTALGNLDWLKPVKDQYLQWQSNSGQKPQNRQQAKKPAQRQQQQQRTRPVSFTEDAGWESARAYHDAYREAGSDPELKASVIAKLARTSDAVRAAIRGEA